MFEHLSLVTCILFVLPQCLLGACPDVRKWPGHAIINSSAAYTHPHGRRVLTVLGSADISSVSVYGPRVTSLFDALNATSSLSFLMGGCSGLMGSPTSFCVKGGLGVTCNIYDGFWNTKQTDLDLTGYPCIQDCELHLGIKVHLVASRALEEEIITGGSKAGKGDGFIVLPGGIGTTRELYDVLQANFEYRNVNKPIFCLNVNGSGRLYSGFYGGLIHWISQLYADKLLKPYPGSSGSSFYISSNATLLASAIDEWAESGVLPQELLLENLINVTGLAALNVIV